MNSQKSHSKNHIQSVMNVLQVIDKVKDAEIRQDVHASEEILHFVWKNFEEDPNFSGFGALSEARLLRLSGSFLSRFGHAKGLESFQERGKNLISKAINQFEVEGATHEAFEAKVYLATAYTFDGQNDEAEIILEDVTSHYGNNQLHPVYLLAQINTITGLHWKKDFQQALEILEKIKIPMDLCDDASLLSHYHNQAGMIMRGVEKYNSAVNHYKTAIRNGYIVGKKRGIGLYLNNLAYLNSCQGDHQEANENILESLQIFEELEDSGWIAMVFDTKAQIHLRENKLELALESVDEAIFSFEKGERYSAYTDALWIKTCILLRMDKKEEAFGIFAELTDIASREIGEYAVKKYTKQLSKIIYSIKELGYHKEVRAFRRQILRDSLVDSGLDTKKAAKKLKINEDNLLNILNREFSGIYDELGNKHKIAFI